jgi:hypothetical protein
MKTTGSFGRTLPAASIEADRHAVNYDFGKSVAPQEFLSARDAACALPMH